LSFINKLYLPVCGQLVRQPPRLSMKACSRQIFMWRTQRFLSGKSRSSTTVTHSPESLYFVLWHIKWLYNVQGNAKRAILYCNFDVSCKEN